MHATLVFLNTLLIAFESIMAIMLTNSLFKRRYTGGKYRLLVLVFLVAHPLFLYFWGDNIFVKLTISGLLLILWTKVTFRSDLVKCIFESILLMSYWAIVDNLFLLSSVSLAHQNLELLLENPYAYYMLCFSAKIIEFFGVILLCFWIKTHLRAQAASWVDWLRSLFFPCASLLISRFLLRILYIEPKASQSLLLCTIILLFANVMSIFLLDYMEKHQLAIRDNAILRQNLKTERDGIAAWMDAYKEQRKQSHDFQNQLSVLRGMIENNTSRSDFAQYLDRLLTIELPATLYINTHRPVADVLFSQKSSIAKNKNIEFSTQLDDLSNFPLPDDALVVVLSNLLDNAINAADKTPDGKRRYILVKMRVGEEDSYLYVENSTGKPVQIIENRVIGVEPSSLEHGYGLQNIAAMLNRHNAIYAIDYREDDGAFCFSAQVFSDI